MNTTPKALLPLCVIFILLLSTLNSYSQLNTLPTESIRLKSQSEFGANGAAVTYNADKKLYYTCYAGNINYPIEIFTKKGKYKNDQAPGFDVRGIWYNPESKHLEGNAYGDKGYYSKYVDGSGTPVITATNVTKGQNQPNENSCGVADTKRKEVLFYDDGQVSLYNWKDGKKISENNVTLSSSLENYNSTSLAFFGESEYYVGLYDFKQGVVIVLDEKFNLVTTIMLPVNAPAESMFNFSYANGHIWLFDKLAKEWIGYKVM